MSTHSHHATDGHNKNHVPHILPLKYYVGTWLTLMVLTAITFAASYVNFGSWNLVIALLIATIKASVVALIFMHLAFDRKFHLVIITSSILFLAILISLTMFDTEFRGQSDAIEKEHPIDVKQPFAGTKNEQRLKAHAQSVSSSSVAQPAAPSH